MTQFFNLRTCFSGRASNYDLKQRCVRQQEFRSPKKNLDIFSDNAFLSEEYERQGRVKRKRLS
ncbi:hypothetical protein FORC89_p071 (plasmid) [Salmonella sp. FORC89]|nr:hypothetical protein FORC51_p0010 [Salmonella enterica]AXX38927.1 hypothetical protein FORC74_p111 [Salmonella enterica]QIS37650.1 hypothetical protein [Salmonella enterica subsp. enterica serovar Enteritidis]QIS37760.1 hypothetical protein [Salmonella enterica subsp. enterica serovar Enteritidis]UWN40199.1 hypothetical protein FORC89_p071 [Salmonella sp. FORC89]